MTMRMALQLQCQSQALQGTLSKAVKVQSPTPNNCAAACGKHGGPARSCPIRHEAHTWNGCLDHTRQVMVHSKTPHA